MDVSGPENTQVIAIIYTLEDVYGMAEEYEIDPDVAVGRALEWGKYIADTASGLCAEQLESCIRYGSV